MSHPPLQKIGKAIGPEVGMPLFTTALDLFGGVLWSGKPQGFISHEMLPTATASCRQWLAGWHVWPTKGFYFCALRYPGRSRAELKKKKRPCTWCAQMATCFALAGEAR
jgi:hypothetical protein